ncbi:class I SAM-dependent methyltransferase [Gloeocapsa sp. PCC 73106]|uniref:class I SAM-dependent methyltransferase n=1 Tax=Gloeocapsa sp. PCC 73106 TaxID=102232 RepID=UPI00130E874A|nr:class I SAM-dependent methyltransferase [Gloeocapsa sp. PCC 73106]
MQLLNFAVSCLESGEVYCQIGCASGASLISALVNNPEIMAYGIDEAFNDKLYNYLLEFNLAEQVCICQQNQESFLQELSELDWEDKIGVYYDNNSQSYRDVLAALMSVKPFLSEQALIIVSNFNHPEIEQAVLDFIAWHPPKQVHQLLNTKQSLDSDFDQGLTILLWQSHPNKLQEKKITAQGLLKLANLTNQGKNILLHVGCGTWRPDALPGIFNQEQWEELRLDIDPRVKPDLLSSITDLAILPDNSVNAIYSSHNLEHIYDFEVPVALAEFKRVLKPGGFVLLAVPDLQIAAEWVIRGDLSDTPLYNSPAGDVPALWMFYGMGTVKPNIPYMAHKTGFTANSLQTRLLEVGFNRVEVVREFFNVIAYGYK